MKKRLSLKNVFLFENPLGLQTNDDTTENSEQTELDNIYNSMLLSYNNKPMAELGVLLAFLKAAYNVHQGHHWIASGNDFYGDHLLFQRIYEESLPFIDSVAERAVGSEGGSGFLVDPIILAKNVSFLVSYFEGGMSTAENVADEKLIAVSLQTENTISKALDMTRNKLASYGKLSSGTDNLLQGISDKHEEFVYLLKQRIK